MTANRFQKAPSFKSARTGFVAAVALAATFTAAFPVLSRAEKSSDASTGVRAKVEAYFTTWQAHDATALAAYFRKNADMLVGNIGTARGRDAIEAWWRSYFARQEAARGITHVVNSLRIISPDVALVDVTTTTGSGPDGASTMRAREARGTWLLTLDDSGWGIAAIWMMPSVRDDVVLGESHELENAGNPGDVPTDLEELVRLYRAAFNSFQPEAVSAFYTADADIIVRNAPAIRGKDAISNWWRVYFSSPRAPADFDLLKVQSLTPDAAIVEVLATGPRTDSKGNAIPARQAHGAWLVVHQSGAWKIAALRVLPGKPDRVIRGEAESRRCVSVNPPCGKGMGLPR